MKMHRAGIVALAALVMACTGSTPVESNPPSIDPGPSATSVASPVSTPTPDPSPVVVGDGESWIVYQLYDGAFNLHLVRPDGTGDHAVFSDRPGDQLHPDWSPDGSQLTFEVDGTIWIANVDGSDARQIADCQAPCRDLATPAWSPDGSTIAFTRIDLIDGQNPGSSIHAVDVSTGSVRELVRTEGAEYLFNGRWSPDGRSLVADITRYSDTSNDTSRVIGTAVVVVDLGVPDPEPRVLTDWTMFAAYPDWNRIDGRIVFSTYDLGTRDSGPDGFEDRTQPSDLYTIRPDGTGLTQLTRNPTGPTLVRNGTAAGPLSTQPSWTPDGRSIIFVQVDGAEWPGWAMAMIGGDGTGLAPATASGSRVGTHPRLRPTP